MRLTADHAALFICACFAALALLYVARTPAFEAPDEASHFLYAHNLQQTDALPVLEDRQTMFASASVQRHHPPLYYIIAAALILPTERGDIADYLQTNPFATIGVVSPNNQNVYLHPPPPPAGDTHIAIAVLRLFSIALGAGTVWLVYRIGVLATDHASTGLLAALLTALIPTFIHISASVNNDNLVIFLFTAGVYIALRLWRTPARADVIALCLILPAIALTKVNGLALFAVIYGVLLAGVVTGRCSWRRAAAIIALTLASSALLAGWWYLRNIQLYGDPLAMQATLRVWGRGGEPVLIPAAEIIGVWESFWFVLGHFNVRGPAWFYDVYLPLAGGVALIGLALRRWNLRMLLLAGVVLLALVMLVAATSRINVSQGRILYPGIAGFAVLLALGWQRLRAGVLIVPLALAALLAPALALPRAYPPAHVVESVPADARRIDARAESLDLLAYRLDSERGQPGDILRLTLYLRGQHPANPYLFVAAVGPQTGDAAGRGVTDFYPAMMPTDALNPESIYAVPVAFQVGAGGPYRLRLELGWRTPEGAYLPLADGQGQPLESLLVRGPLLIDPAQQPDPPQQAAQVDFGGRIRLDGLTVTQAGEDLNLALHWQAVTPMPRDYLLTLRLIDSAGEIVVLEDSMPPGYVTSDWQTGLAFATRHTFALAPGDYRLEFGWYDPASGQRLPPNQHNQHDLYVHPETISVR